MSNELNNIIARTPTVYMRVLLLVVIDILEPPSLIICSDTKQEPDCKILVLLGEVGGVEEYRVLSRLSKRVTITKPIVAWAIGTCASMFKTEVQFGHAGASANSELETALVKNQKMRGSWLPRS